MIDSAGDDRNHRSFTAKLEALRPFVAERHQRLAPPFPAVTLFFSVSDGDARAQVTHARGPSFEAAWETGTAALAALMAEHRLEGRWLRVDWVNAAQALTGADFSACLGKAKRNYFRLGLAFDPDFDIAFLEQEINANAMLYGGNTIEHAVLNAHNCRIYTQRRFGANASFDFSDDGDRFLLSTRAVFCDEAGALHELHGDDLNAGRRKIPVLSEAVVSELIATSSAYLARQVKADGSFIYGYHPCFDRRIEAYNALRHASSTYAMIEAWEVTRDAGLRDAIDRALTYLTTRLIRPASLPDGTLAAFLVDVGDEIKLGGNAVCLLALTKYSQATGTADFLPLLEQLALGICSMQDPTSGAFVHVLHFPSLAVKQAHRTIYYDGEAAFGLMRLYSLTRDPRWIAAVEKGFEYFIAQRHWKHHDHWLSYSVNELTRYRPEERYFRFGIQNVADHLDFVRDRITTFPTLLELMMAARAMLERLQATPELHHLLRAVDLRKFERALIHRAHYLLNGHFWPEMAMYFRTPERIVGSFFIRHHGFRVRIDDVEHYLSGFIAYRKHLLEGTELLNDAAMLADVPAGWHDAGEAPAGWNARNLEVATSGRWTTPVPDDWSASGLCIHAPTLQPGEMVVERPPEGQRGVPRATIRHLPFAPAAIITRDPAPELYPDVPLLQVDDPEEAILQMGRYARSRFAGKVLAITGSAGKTTTAAMLAHALGAWGQTYTSAHNANLPHGVAWNLASVPCNAPYAVLELAIGNMGQSARMARPHVAIFTNILPAHLNGESTVADVARTKGAIFRGMAPGGIAVLNGDMMEWETVRFLARQAQLKIVRYGSAPDADLQLLEHVSPENRVVARSGGEIISYRVGAAGSHMALNSLAVLAATSALGLPLGPAIARLESFAALPGRGEPVELVIDGRRITVIDDAYNANPGSMLAALDRLSREEQGRRRIAVLGQMAELGAREKDYHTELAEVVTAASIDRIYVTGELYGGFWDRVPVMRRGAYATGLDELKSVLRQELAEGDVVLVKGSHSTRMHQIVAWMKEVASNGRLPGATGHHTAEERQPDRTTPGHHPPACVSTLLYDAGRNAIVAAENETELHAPASLTKLLTLSLVEERLLETGLPGNEPIEVSRRAAAVDSWWGFAAGEKVGIDVLMRACAVVSSNEAANALAEWHSGSIERFTQALNERARDYGMQHTRLSSPSGLGRDQTISAVDALTLARQIYARHPGVAALCAERHFRWKGKVHPSTNRLLDALPGADGLKTGTLRGAGNSIIFSASHGGNRWIAIVLGAPTKPERDSMVRRLMETCALLPT